MRTFAHIAVVAGILVVAVSLLLAFLGRVREAAARAQSSNNLKQIGLAMHNYESAIGHLPPAIVDGVDLPPEKRLNWLFELDPYIWARMDPDWLRDKAKPWDHESNVKLWGERMRIVNCPSQPVTTTDEGYVLSHYVGVAGLGENAAMLPKGDPNCGVFGYSRHTKLTDITDGTDLTLMAAETRRWIGPWVAGGPTSVRGVVPAEMPLVGKNAQFGGCHRGGVMALFADGSVRFIADTIRPQTFGALATVAAGDGPGPFDFE